MDFAAIFVISYCILAEALIGFFIWRTLRIGSFFNRHRWLAWTTVIFLTISQFVGLYARFFEPFRLVATRVAISFPIKQTVRVGLISDMQVGNHKQTDWMQKVVTKASQEKPDIILIAGDLISNDETSISQDETVHLDPLKRLLDVAPVYYVLGNHDYGIGARLDRQSVRTSPDKHELVMQRMAQLGIPLLRNELVCPTLREQQLCIFGTDDIWGRSADYARLSNWDKRMPLILLSHNPDSILYWPKDIKKPDLILAGHTHGGQIYLPVIGPLGNAVIELGKKHYRWLSYWENIPLFVTVGSGESLGALRLFTPPEVAIISLTP